MRIIISVLERTLFWKSEVSGSHGHDLVHEWNLVRKFTRRAFQI
jgi:hypothetical protein